MTPTETNQVEEHADKSARRSSTYKQDFLASIVVFLVALPLCMGIAIASGVPVAAGLITGIVGGLIVGWIAGAPLQVSGPAAGLTVIVFDLVQHHGLEVLGIAVLIGGALQLTAGLLGYGRWFRAVSPAVIHGMLAGIGVLIFSNQFHVMVDDLPKGSGIANLIAIPEAVKKGLPIPELGPVEERKMRRDLLQQFGSLHEQQIQLREDASERTPVPSSESDQHSRDPSEAELIHVESLKPLATKQESLSVEFETLAKQIEENDVAGRVRDPAVLAKAIENIRAHMQVAIEDLQQGAAQQVRRSQAATQHDMEEVLSQLKNHDWAAKIGLLTIVVLILWRSLAPARLRLMPAPLLAVIVATTAAAALQLPVLYVEVPNNLWNEIHFPSLSVLSSVSPAVIIQAGIVLAVVASAETLLCATALDQLQSGTRTKYDRELAAQGVGNMVCGLLGALPMTGVIVRSSANVEAGAKTRLSTILHGLWLLVFVSALAFVLRMIPTAALAAMLVFIGYKLVNVKAVRDLKKYGWGEVVIYFATLGTIIATDLLTGVLTGIALSAVKLLHKFSHLGVRLDVAQQAKTAVLRLEGAATFVRLPRLASVLEEVPPDVELHVDFEHLDYIDHACLDLLMNWAKQHEATGGTLVIDWESLHSTFSNGPARNQQVRPTKTA